MANTAYLLKIPYTHVTSGDIPSGWLVVSDGSDGWTQENHYTKAELRNHLVQIFHNESSGGVTIGTGETDVISVSVSDLGASDDIYIICSGMAMLGEVWGAAGYHSLSMQAKVYRDAVSLETYDAFRSRGFYGDDAVNQYPFYSALSHVNRDAAQTGSKTYKWVAWVPAEYDIRSIKNPKIVVIVEKYSV